MEDMTPKEIMDGMRSKNRTLSRINRELLNYAETKAQKDRDYKILKSKEIVRLRADKTPATIILKLVDGDETVAKAEFDAKIAEEIYRIKLEELKDTRTAIDTYRSLLTWMREEFKNVNVGQ